jgi:hypothetical protein
MYCTLFGTSLGLLYPTVLVLIKDSNKTLTQSQKHKSAEWRSPRTKRKKEMKLRAPFVQFAAAAESLLQQSPSFSAIVSQRNRLIGIGTFGKSTSMESFDSSVKVASYKRVIPSINKIAEYRVLTY